MRQVAAGPDTQTRPTSRRHYELDWLRTLVVLGLIPVHTASLFTPTQDLFLKNGQTSSGMEMIGAFGGVFGMPTLFFVSGAAAWYALASRTSSRFARERVARLLVPLLFATLAILPIQDYIVALHNPKLMLDSGIPIYSTHVLDSFLSFYPQYLFGYGYFLTHPSVNGFIIFVGHLWFVLYLFIFSLLALPLFTYLRGANGRRLLEWLSAACVHPGMIFALAAPLAVVDLVAHLLWRGVGAIAEILIYFVCFIYGYALYGDARIRQAIYRAWPVALALGLAVWLVANGLLIKRPLAAYDNSTGAVLGLPLRGIIAWLFIVGLLGFAQRFLSRDSALLQYLSDAAYPIYVLHVAAIVWMGYLLLGWGAPIAVKYGVIIIASVALLLIVYDLLVRRIRPLRRLFGLRDEPRRDQTTAPSLITLHNTHPYTLRALPSTASWRDLSAWMDLKRTRGKRLGETMFADKDALFSTEGGHAAMMKWYEHALEHAHIKYESIVVPTRFGESHLVAVGPEDAPALVLLHGMEGNAASWRHQLAGLQADFRLYALDIIGSAGKSVPTRLDHDNDDHAKWLDDVLTELRIEHANLVGISNGSWLILKLAAHAPQRIARAALMSANGIAPVRFPYRLARLMDEPAVRVTKDALAGALLTRDMVRRAVSGTYVADVNADPGEIEWFYLLAKYYRFRFPPGPVDDAELASLTAPTLLLMGEQERFFAIDAVIERARRLMPHVEAEVIPGVGHNMCTDDPARVNERLRTYFSTKVETTRA